MDTPIVRPSIKFIDVGGVSVARIIPAYHLFALPIVFVSELPRLGLNAFLPMMESLAKFGYECQMVAISDLELWWRTYHQEVILVSCYSPGIPVAVAIKENRSRVVGYACIYDPNEALKDANYLESILLELVAIKCKNLKTIVLPSSRILRPMRNWICEEFNSVLMPQR